jgi:hypothetical protein
MKLLDPTCHSSHNAERGSAVLVILVMLSIMVTFAIANSRTTYHLQRDLQLIEKRQLKRYESTAGNHAALGSQETETLLAAADPSATPRKPTVGQASLPASLAASLPPVEHSGQGCPENRQPRWLPNRCARNAEHGPLSRLNSYGLAQLGLLFVFPLAPSLASVKLREAGKPIPATFKIRLAELIEI